LKGRRPDGRRDRTRKYQTGSPRSSKMIEKLGLRVFPDRDEFIQGATGHCIPSRVWPRLGRRLAVAWVAADSRPRDACAGSAVQRVLQTTSALGCRNSISYSARTRAIASFVVRVTSTATTRGRHHHLRPAAAAPCARVGRVLGMPYGQGRPNMQAVQQNNPAKPVTLGQALETEQLLKEQYRPDARSSGLIDLAMQIEASIGND